MAEFTFKSGIKTLDILDEITKEVVVTYSIDVGNKEQTQRWIKKINGLDITNKKFSEDEKAIDELEESLKSVVDAILGEEAWTFLWEKYTHNIGSMTAFVKYLSSFLNEELTKIYKGYV